MKNALSKIRGAGGGGKSGGGSARAPVESPDNLRSIQNARVLDLISEGEIGGLINGLKSVFLNDTPIQNADDTFNFNSVVMDERTGTQAQLHVTGFDGAEAETAVGAEVKLATSVTRTVSNINNTAVRVTLSTPQMTLQDVTTGDLGGTSVEIAIDIQNNGGGFVAAALRKIFTPDGFAVGSISRNTIDTTQINVTATWVKQAIQSPQTLTCKLQYRLFGNTIWLDYATHTFSGHIATASSSIIGSIFKVVNVNNTKTFNVTLAVGQYEFQLIKLTGSIQNASTLGLPQTPSVGMAYGGSVSITAGEVFVPVNTDIISGKTTSKYQRAYRLDLPAGGPWDIRVRRITADSTQSVLQNKTFWDSYTEIIDAKLSYPNSALVGMQIDAKQFNAIPSRGYEINGIKVKIPNNYDALTRVYTGVWGGNFNIAWSNNPAWVFYDLITNARYGLGAYISESQVDKWSLYSIAQYCDEMVEDGFGGIEPRFTCNVYLQTREDAFRVIDNLASIFRSMVYWAAGSIHVSQDSPQQASAQFTPANVFDGVFNYSGSSGKVRHTVALIAWNDPQDGYRQKVEYVDDAAGIARYGVIEAQIQAIGCTSRGQAHRVGGWLLYSEQNETETVTFKAGMDSVYVAPGDIIKTQDPLRAGVRFGGRLISGNISAVVLDAAISIGAGTYTISCILPNGSVEDRTVVNAAGSTANINVTPNFTDAPQAYSIWTMASDSLAQEEWRVVSIAEADKTTLEINALAYRPNKYTVIEQGLLLQPLATSIINAGNPDMPANLIVNESLYLAGLNVVGVGATVSWDSTDGANQYTLTYQLENQNAIIIENIHTTNIDIKQLNEGNYTFTVYATDTLGRRSQNNSISQIIYGKTTPPKDITGFTVIKVAGIAQPSWDVQPDLDVQVGGYIVVRHSPLTSGANWQDGVILDTFSGNTVSGSLPLITGTYMAKALDSTGNWSANSVSFVATEGLVTGFSTVATSTQHSAFAGLKTNVANTGTSIQLVGATLIDDMLTNIDDWSFIDSLGGIVANGTYAFDAAMDLTTVLTRRFEADIAALSFDMGDFIDSRTDNIDNWGLMDGNTVNDCDVTLWIATTNTDPAGSPVWTAWAPFFVGDFTCRAAKFQLNLESANLAHNISVSTLRVDAKIPV